MSSVDAFQAKIVSKAAKTATSFGGLDSWLPIEKPSSQRAEFVRPETLREVSQVETDRV